MLLFAHFCIFWYSTIFTQRTLERILCRSNIHCVHPKNPIILANLGEPIDYCVKYYCGHLFN